MKLTLTGSLGNIGKPLTKILVAKGHSVTVISSNREKQHEIASLGAIPAIGNLEDSNFLASAFTDAEAVYAMEPPVNFFDHKLDVRSYYSHLGENFVSAILKAKVGHVVHLSSIGGDMKEGNGILTFHHLVETIMQSLPKHISLMHIRPLAFYYNLLGFIPGIKKAGKITANYGGPDTISWASPFDIAEAIAEELVSSKSRRVVRYVVSDELTCTKTASILGAAIGKPDLRWDVIVDNEMQTRLEGIGMAPHLAAGLVEMNAAMHSGTLFEDYQKNKPTAFGNVKMTDYAQEFAKQFNS